MSNANKNFEKINALRAKVANVNASACSFNQAVKSLGGLEAKYEDVLADLGIASFGFKNICGAWAEDLHTSKDGKPVMALYQTETAKVTVTNAKGEPKEVNAYERIVNKKGEVSFKAIKVRTLSTPKAWSAAVILEGLVQSVELDAAKEEAKVADEYFVNLVEEGEVYIKCTEKNVDGSVRTYYEQA